MERDEHRGEDRAEQQPPAAEPVLGEPEAGEALTSELNTVYSAAIRNELSTTRANPTSFWRAMRFSRNRPSGRKGGGVVKSSGVLWVEATTIQ